VRPKAKPKLWFFCATSLFMLSTRTPMPAPLPTPATVAHTWSDGRVRVHFEIDRTQEENIRARAAAAVHPRFGWLRALIMCSGCILSAAIVTMGTVLAAPQLSVTTVVSIASMSGVIVGYLLAT
jgi:hypothetical protein